MKDLLYSLVIWLLALSPTVPFEAIYREASIEHGSLPWSLLAAQGYVESAGFNPLYVYGPLTGALGEKGVGQFMPGTWEEWGEGSPWDPRNAIHAQAKYLAWIDEYLCQMGLEVLTPGLTLLVYRHGPRGALAHAARGWFPKSSRQYLKAIRDYRNLIKEDNGE